MILSGLSEAERRAYLLADNKLVENAGWDRAGLAVELKELAPLLASAGLDISLTGFQPAEIDTLMGPAQRDQATSRIGDLWELGPRRLLCGNARSATHLRRLMGVESAALVIADPPTQLADQARSGPRQR